MNKNTVHVIGAGLAGSEAAWQLAMRGINVIIHEMKPHKFSPAHKNSGIGFRYSIALHPFCR